MSTTTKFSSVLLLGTHDIGFFFWRNKKNIAIVFAEIFIGL